MIASAVVLAAWPRRVLQKDYNCPEHRLTQSMDCRVLLVNVFGSAPRGLRARVRLHYSLR